MYQLKFDENICYACDSYDCLMKCQYLDMDVDTARIEMGKIISGEASFVLTDCVTCYACEEYCQKGNHPFYLIVSQQEELNLLPLPDPLIKRGVQLGIPFRGEPEIEEIQGTALNLGVFSQLSNMTQGKLFDGTTLMSEDSRKSFPISAS
jgi:ferredoxin